MPAPIYLKLAIPTPLRRLFEYLPPALPAPASGWQIGQRMRVPFGKQELIGVIAEIGHESAYADNKLKPALECLDESSLLPADLQYLCAWATQYYQCPPGEVYSTAFPALLRQGGVAAIQGEPSWRLSTEGKGIPEQGLKRAPKQAEVLAHLRLHDRLSDRALKDLGVSSASLKALLDKSLIQSFTHIPAVTNTEDLNPDVLAEASLTLNEEQRIALQAIDLKQHQTYLLEGTTGSGKTEVYLQAIAECLKAGKQALVLIPEIGLTPQTLGRFQSRFNVPIASLHSGMNDKERMQAWLQAQRGYARIIVGTRSAIFTPMVKPGIIIVDEEHDASFKQQDASAILQGTWPPCVQISTAYLWYWAPLHLLWKP